MAPNVKENIGQLDLSNHRLDASFIKNASLPKYLPLTSGYEESEQSALFVAPIIEVRPVHIIENDEKAESCYWDWEQPTPEEEKAKLIANILEEEKCRQAVSTDNIIAKLMTASSQRNEETIYNEENEEEDYWNMPSDAPEHDEDDLSPFSVSQIERLLIQEVIDRAIASTSTSYVTAAHVGDKNHPANSYWDWTSAPCTEEERKRVLLEQILKEESIRTAFTIEHIEETLNQFASSSKISDGVTSSLKNDDNYWFWKNKDASLQEAPHVNDDSHPNHEYWHFPSPPCTDVERNKSLLEKIMKEESIRQILSTKHMESNEISKLNFIISSETRARIINSNTLTDDHYWNWDTNTSTIIEAPHINDHTHPIHSYWDHPTEAITEEDKKTAIVAQILKEESIRISLSSSAIESFLKSHVDKEMQCQEKKENSHSYWDW